MTDALAHAVVPGMYRDSVSLMLISTQVQRLDGVLSASAVMATPANMEVLARTDLVPPDVVAAPDDLLLVVRATSEEVARHALDMAIHGLDEAVASGGTGFEESRPATIDEGLAAYEDANLVSVSVAGAYAPLLVKQALLRGRHVFCFSDNVSVADEVALKSIADERGLLLMGPDCGTALIDGTPLGFVNAVSSGPVGIVSASGTGAQEVMCQLDDHGIGVSQVIGVGGRDMSREVGGRMTDRALDLLSEDDGTSCVILVGKPPAAEVAERLFARLVGFPKPVVACLLGGAPKPAEGSLTMCSHLAEAARLAAEICGAAVVDNEDNEEVVALPALSAAGVLGLYTGGTLATEARYILADRAVAARVLDLGDDEYTVGRPHPMIDPSQRGTAIVESAADPQIGVLLVDLVLGYGAMSDPATPLAEAVTKARGIAEADGRALLVIASVCGTPADSQGIEAQRRISLTQES